MKPDSKPNDPATPLVTPIYTRDPDIKDPDVVVKVGEGVLIVLTAGFWALSGLYVVGPRECRVILHNGRLTGIEGRPGLHWRPAFCRADRLTTTADISVDLPVLKVVDITGCPIVASAVLVYRIVDAKKALLHIENVHKYVTQQATAALKLIVSQYSYEALKMESTAVQEQVVVALQDKCIPAGTQVISMTLNELNYAPEIASAMLKKQQAAALIAARELIVEGACQICKDAVTNLEANGLNLQEADKVKIVTNLLTVTCSDDNAKPVINV